MTPERSDHLKVAVKFHGRKKILEAALFDAVLVTGHDPTFPTAGLGSGYEVVNNPT